MTYTEQLQHLQDLLEQIGKNNMEMIVTVSKMKPEDQDYYLPIVQRSIDQYGQMLEKSKSFVRQPESMHPKLKP